jgi:hypothetical protein
MAYDKNKVDEMALLPGVLGLPRRYLLIEGTALDESVASAVCRALDASSTERNL